MNPLLISGIIIRLAHRAALLSHNRRASRLDGLLKQNLITKFINYLPLAGLTIVGQSSINLNINDMRKH